MSIAVGVGVGVGYINNNEQTAAAAMATEYILNYGTDDEVVNLLYTDTDAGKDYLLIY